MSAKRKVEIFSAGCPLCEQAGAAVRRIACPSCVVEVLDMRDSAIAAKAERYGVRSIPAIAVDGRLAACCTAGGLDATSLRAAGVGVPLP